MITRTRSGALRLFLAGAVAALALTVVVHAASANRLSINETRWTHRWAVLNFIAGARTVKCAVTVEGSFHSAVSQKVVGSLSGLVSRAAIAACTGGSATVLTESLPWHYTYTGFTGVLPEIASIETNLIGASFKIKPTNVVACLVRMTTEESGRGIIDIEETGAATEIAAESGAEIRLTGEGGLCPFAGNGHFEGTGTITTLSRGTLTVRLI